MQELGLISSGTGAAKEPKAKKTAVMNAEAFMFAARDCSWKETGGEERAKLD